MPQAPRTSPGSAGFKYKRRVHFSETDMAGIAHFSVYFRFLEEAEHALWRAAGLSIGEVALTGGWPRVSASFDYKSPLRFEDEVLIHLLVERKGERSLTYQFRFYRLDGATSREVARGKVTAACAVRRASCSSPLPKFPHNP